MLVLRLFQGIFVSENRPDGRLYPCIAAPDSSQGILYRSLLSLVVPKGSFMIMVGDVGCGNTSKVVSNYLHCLMVD